MCETTANLNPYVKIIEEPCSRGTRFRYDSEGRFAGCIAGVNSTPEKKTWPTIQIMNYTGRAFVVVSCVTKDEPHKPHPHNIVGKAPETSQGICYFKTVGNESVISFPNIGIQCVKRKDIIKSLEERERLNVDPFKTGYDHNNLLDKIDLTCIRLCFQVFLEGQIKDIFNIPLNPAVSVPVYDKKASAALAIWWISHYSAPVTGGTVVCLLCEKVTKDDIQVRFYNEKIQWEATAEFSPPKYHKQVAVIFKTPQYIDQDINQPVRVTMQLRRPSDGEVSKPVPFEFIPAECDSEDGFKVKRQRRHESPRDLVFRHLHEKAEQNFHPSLAANTFPIIKTEPWESSSTIIYKPNILMQSAQCDSNDQINICREKASISHTTMNNFNRAYYNTQPMMQDFIHTMQNSTANNNLMVQMWNPTNNYPNYVTDRQYPGILNEQRSQQNPSYSDELLTTMMEHNL